MENNYKLEKLEAISIFIIIMINKLILNIPYYIINRVGTGAITNIIYIGIIDLIFLLIIVKLLSNFENSDILDIAEFLGGKTLKIIIGIISIMLFFLVSHITLLDFSNVLHTIYYSDFDMIYILLFFILGIIFANFIGFKSITRTILLIVPFAIISVLITFITIFNSFDIKNLTPIFGQNYYSVFGLGITNCFAMYIIIYIYFMKPLLKKQQDFKKISIISYLISFALLFLTVISMLTIFNMNSEKEPINSLFLLARQIEFGKFIQRVDAIFIFLWMLSIFSYLSFVIFLINRIIKKIINISNEKMLTFPICSILFGLTIIPLNISELRFLENTIYRYIILIFMFGIGIFILSLANFKKRKV